MKPSWLMLLACSAWLARADTNDLLIADFEGETYGAWTAEGEAFGAGSATGAFPGQKAVRAFAGNRLVNSFSKGDALTGRLRSPEFVVQRRFIRFLIGGAELPGVTCVNLLVDDKVVRTATGLKSKIGRNEALRYEEWDVAEFKGTRARIEIVDDGTKEGAHVLVDDILQTDSGLQRPALKLAIEKTYLLMPVKNRARNIPIQFALAGATVREFEIELAAGVPPDWQAFYDVSAFKGQTLQIRCLDKLPEAMAKAFPTLFTQSDEPIGVTDLYHERFRPQFHYTVRRGYNNDPNGLVFFNGEYHIFYQNNPFGIDWGNMHWGHAASRDLLHWTELPPAIYPRGIANGAFSGGASVDYGNKMGFGQGKEDVLLAAYTSVGRGECVAFGTGRALALTEIPGCPVLKHKGWDPNLIRYAPADKWLMVVFEKNDPAYGYAIYDSKDLRSWRRLSFIEGFQDCPDLFELPVEGETARKWVLYGSKKEAAKRYASRSSYMLGAFDGNTFVPETGIVEGHAGPQFYAGQAFNEVPGGRQIMLGWLAGGVYPGMPFSQGLTVPLELKLRRQGGGLKLCFTPVRELEQLQRKRYAGQDLSLPAANELFSKTSAELLDIELTAITGSNGKFTLAVRGVEITYDAAASELACKGQKAALSPESGRLRLRVLVDRGVLELFANDGSVAMAFAGKLYAESAPVELKAVSDAKVADLQVAELQSIWEK